MHDIGACSAARGMIRCCTSLHRNCDSVSGDVEGGRAYAERVSRVTSVSRCQDARSTRLLRRLGAVERIAECAALRSKSRRATAGATLCIQPVVRKLWVRSAFPVLSHGGEYHVPSRSHSSCGAHSTAGPPWSRRDHGRAAELALRMPSRTARSTHRYRGRDINAVPTQIVHWASLRAGPRLLRGQSHDSGLAARARSAFVDGDPAAIRHYAVRARRNVPRALARSGSVPSGWAAGAGI